MREQAYLTTSMRYSCSSDPLDGNTQCGVLMYYYGKGQTTTRKRGIYMYSRKNRDSDKQKSGTQHSKLKAELGLDEQGQCWAGFSIELKKANNKTYYWLKDTSGTLNTPQPNNLHHKSHGDRQMNNAMGEGLFAFSCFALAVKKSGASYGGTSASMNEVKEMYEAAKTKLGTTSDNVPSGSLKNIGFDPTNRPNDLQQFLVRLDQV